MFYFFFFGLSLFFLAATTLAVDSQSPEQVNATDLPFIFKLETLITGTNRLHSTNVLSPRSVQCTFLYHAVQLKIQKLETVEVLCLLLSTQTRNQNQHAVIIHQRFDHHSLHYSCCFNYLSFGVVSFLGNAFLAHTAVRSQMSRLVAIVRLTNIQYQSSSSFQRK